MKVSGFTFIRNAEKNDYPIVEAITSILPLCDEFIVALGDSQDNTGNLIKSINSDKIKIIPTVWNSAVRHGGEIFAEQTNVAFKHIATDADWAFYIQGDEAVHENDLPLIKEEMQANLADLRVEGLLFKYIHFYGSYDFFGSSRRWYRREIRIVRNNPSVHSYRDAQGFRWNKRKLNVKLINATIYHYGWVKPPAGLKNKLLNFNQFYHDDTWIKENLPKTFEFDYSNADGLLPFKSSHPAVMKSRIKAKNWKLSVDIDRIKKKMTLRRKLLQKLEDFTGWRVGEYKNYNIIR